MKQYQIDPENPDSRIIIEVAEIITSGGVVAHPTETVYGLTTVWDDIPALQRVALLKGRDTTQPFSIMVDAVEDILNISGWEIPEVESFLQNVFPAPLTLLLPRLRELPVAYWNRFPDLGFRMPQHELSRKLVHICGKPLITTSANLSGGTAPVSAGEISPSISSGCDIVLDSGPCKLGSPSTVIWVDFENQSFKLIRKGAYSLETFRARFNDYLNS